MTEELHRDFKGVWIPKEIWLNAELSITEKAFLTEIDSLDNQDGCYASNKHFQVFSGLSLTRCSRIISGLSQKGFISIRYIREGKEVKKRVIKVLRKRKGVLRKSNPPIAKTQEGYCENGKGSNTKSSNTKYSNTKRENRVKAADATSSLRTEIIDYMNELYGSNFKPNSKDTREKINGRLNDGFSVDDFKLAIAGQWLNWKDDKKMRQHLVPKTIFRLSNFEGYVESAKRRKDIKQDIAIAKQDEVNTEELPF